MNQQNIACSMCGFSFDPAGHAACQSCPLATGCSLVCCPQCGYETVNLQQSRLAGLVARFFPPKKSTPPGGALNLVGIRPGRQAKVTGFDQTLQADQHAHLQAYGVAPGRLVRVLQHAPVTIIQVEHTELAMEREMAAAIQVVELP